MFGTAMTPVVFIFCCIQIIVLIYQGVYFLLRPKDKSRLHFALLTLSFLYYNIFSGLFYDHNSNISLLTQGILAYTSGIQVFLYFSWFLYEELNIAPLRYYEIKRGAYLALFALMFGLVIPLYLTNDEDWGRIIFISIILGYLLLYFFKITKKFIELFKTKKIKTIDDNHYRRKLLIANIALTFVMSLPIMTLIGNYQIIEHSLINTGYFIVLVLYGLDIFNKNRREYKLLQSIGYKVENKDNTSITELYQNSINSKFEKLNFTSREKEITLFVLQNKTLPKKDIADYLNLSPGGLYGHLSNIYEKLGVKNYKEMIQQFDS